MSLISIANLGAFLLAASATYYLSQNKKANEADFQEIFAVENEQAEKKEAKRLRRTSQPNPRVLLSKIKERDLFDQFQAPPPVDDTNSEPEVIEVAIDPKKYGLIFKGISSWNSEKQAILIKNTKSKKDTKAAPSKGRTRSSHRRGQQPAAQNRFQQKSFWYKLGDEVDDTGLVFFELEGKTARLKDASGGILELVYSVTSEESQKEQISVSSHLAAEAKRQAALQERQRRAKEEALKKPTASTKEEPEPDEPPKERKIDPELLERIKKRREEILKRRREREEEEVLEKEEGAKKNEKK